VEDNALNMELAADLLEAAGFIVLRAANAEEGIALANAEIPALILMDIALPGMDGLCATGILQRNPNTRQIPVVALTAHAMNGDKEKALAVGCVGYISKPINTRTFAAEAERFLCSVKSLPRAA